MSPRGGQADQLLDEVVDDELDGHNHAHVQQTRALRERRGGEGREGGGGRGVRWWWWFRLHFLSGRNKRRKSEEALYRPSV